GPATCTVSKTITGPQVARSKQRCADAAVSGAVKPLGCTGYTAGEPRHRGIIMRRRREVLNDIGIRHTDEPTPHGAEETARERLQRPDEAEPYGGSEEGMAWRQGHRRCPVRPRGARRSPPRRRPLHPECRDA